MCNISPVEDTWHLIQEKASCLGSALICTVSILLPRMSLSSITPFITVRMLLRLLFSSYHCPTSLA